MRGGGCQRGAMAMAMAMAMARGHVTAETGSWRRRAGLSRVLLYNALSVAGINTKSDVECRSSRSGACGVSQGCARATRWPLFSYAGTRGQEQSLRVL